MTTAFACPRASATCRCFAAGRWRPGAASSCTRPITMRLRPRSPSTPDVSLTATVDILRAMAQGEGPRRAVLALGYAGWAGGQLEQEIQQNGWLTCAADESLLFGDDHASKYDRALRKLGIDPAALVSEAGHA